jgi:hypothetical protein
MTNLGVFFKTHEDPCIRSVRVRDFDFSSDRPALALGLFLELRGPEQTPSAET